MRFCFLISLIFFSCSNDPAIVKEFISFDDLPVEKMKDAEIIHTEFGIMKVKVIANNIERYQNQQPHLILSNGLKVIFYNDTVMKSNLEAQYAEINEKEKIMKASNNVVLTSSDGKRLATEELIWDEKENKIYTNKKIVITTKKEIIEGEGFVSNPDFTEYSISKVHGTFDFGTSTE